MCRPTTNIHMVWLLYWLLHVDLRSCELFVKGHTTLKVWKYHYFYNGVTCRCSKHMIGWDLGYDHVNRIPFEICDKVFFIAPLTHILILPSSRVFEAAVFLMCVHLDSQCAAELCALSNLVCNPESCNHKWYQVDKAVWRTQMKLELLTAHEIIYG